MYSDNLNRAPSAGEPFSDFVFQFIPGLSANQIGSHWNSSLSASLQFLNYARASEADDIFLNLNANSNGELIDERVFLNTYARWGQGNVDPADFNVTNENLTSGRTNIATAGIAPSWIQPIGKFAVSEAAANFGIVRFPGDVSGDDPLDDARRVDTDIINLSWLLQSSATDQFYWAAGYYRDQIEYETDQEDLLRRASLDVGYTITRRIQLVGLIGYEDNFFERQLTSAINGWAWNAGFRWTTSPRNLLEFRFGKRPEIGDVYLFSWTFTGQRLGLNARYDQDYSANARQINEGPSEVLPDDLSGIRPDAFLRRYFGGGVTYDTQKTTFRFGAFDEHRRYQQGGREEIIGINAGISRVMSGSSTLLIDFNWRNQDLLDSRGGDNYGLRIAYSRRVGRSWFVRPSYWRSVRDEGQAEIADETTENRVMLELIWDIRPDSSGTSFN